MAFELPGMPNFTVNTPPPVDSLAKMGQLLQLKDMIGQQSLLPYQQQQAQASAQSATTQAQMQANQLASQQAMIKAFGDTDFLKDLSGEGEGNQGQAGVGFSPDAMTKGLISRGVLPQDAMAITGQFVDRANKMSDTLANQGKAGAEQLEVYAKAHEQLADMLAPIMDEKSPQLAQQALDRAKYQLLKSPIPGIDQQDAALVQAATLDHLPAIVNTLGLSGQIADYQTKQYQKRSAQAGAEKAEEELPGGPMNPVTQHIEEETNPAVIQAEAQKSALSQEAIQKALYGGSPLAKVPPALVPAVTADVTKVDQAYTQAQQAGNEMQSMVDLAKGGNKVAYAYSPVTGVLQINVAGQIKRMNMPEIESYGGAGSALDRIKGWLGKAASGASIPQDVLNDMAAVSKMVTQGAATKYQQDLSNLNHRYGSNFQPMGTEGSQSQGTPAIPQGWVTGWGSQGYGAYPPGTKVSATKPQ